MNSLPALIEEYQAALHAGSPATPQEAALYAAHQAVLQHLKSMLAEGGAYQAISELLAQERRSYGWSFLSGKQGERVEQAFNALNNAIAQGHAGQ